MVITQQVVDRLLLSKTLLGRIRFLSVARPDRLTLAIHILTAHDAAELALAGIAHHLGKLPTSGQAYLMNYFPEIKMAHTDREVEGKEFFNQLNRVRNAIKHEGIFPDPQQWSRVGERTYDYVSTWCKQYLDCELDELDESTLISNQEIKQYFNLAQQAYRQDKYREVLENLALAAHALFRSNSVLRGLVVGNSRAEDALKLSAFGVHANDYLGLQEFLPQVVERQRGTVEVKWEQEKFGHPGNWRKEAADFCLRTFLHIALCIQDAEWIPGAIDFHVLYDHKVVALEDGVEIWVEEGRSFEQKRKKVVRSLQRGDCLRGYVRRGQGFLVDTLFKEEQESVLWFANIEDSFFGYIPSNKVRVTCVPKDLPLVAQYFPNLPELDYDD